MSQLVSLYVFASQSVYTSTEVAGEKSSFLLLCKNSKSHWHRRLDVSHVRDLAGKERHAVSWKMKFRNLSAPLGSCNFLLSKGLSACVQIQL